MSTSPNDCGSNGLPVVNWTTDNCGAYNGSAKSPMEGGQYTNPMNQGSQLSLNGNADLSGCIVGPSGGFVQKITYEHHTGPARGSAIYAYGQGPKGTGSGSITLYFLTEAGDTHTLSLTSSSLECHSDLFQDNTPIIQVTWAHT
jgi:hypothetical protein